MRKTIKLSPKINLPAGATVVAMPPPISISLKGRKFHGFLIEKVIEVLSENFEVIDASL